MKTRKLLIALVLAVALLGCGKPQPRHIVILPDVSGSIKRESLEQAFKAIDELAGHLQRGDRLTIIPILGDAEAEASGKILRFEVPANRQAYDTDLRDFRSKLSSSLKEMGSRAILHSETRTDILGSFALAQQEFQSVSVQTKKLMVVLSDFIQDDGQLDFENNKNLANRVSAKMFAARTAKTTPLNLNGVRVYAGFLQSAEYARMEKSRRGGIAEFWSEYLRQSGTSLHLVTDGPGLVRKAIQH
jgi:hypothetical protein